MYYENNNIDLYYEKYGNGGINILILPGWGETRNTFFKMINFLKRNFSVYIFDYPGFGNSPFPLKDLDIYDYANLFKNFLKDNNINDPIIIAHSFGGRIASLLTGFYKIKISKMIFIDVAGIKPKKKFRYIIKEKLYKLLKHIIKIFYKKNRKTLLEKLRRKFASTDYNALPKNMLTTFRNIVNEDLRYYYKNINSDVFIIWGEKDDATPLSDGRFINKVIKDSYLLIFKDGTHFVYLEYSDSINLIIESFITEKN